MRETRPRVAYSGEGCGSSAETLTTDYAGCARNANPCCGLGYVRVGAGAVGETRRVRRAAHRPRILRPKRVPLQNAQYERQAAASPSHELIDPTR